MITKSITIYTPPSIDIDAVPTSKPKYIIGSVGHREFLITKSIEYAIAQNYDYGDEFTAHGHKGVGCLINIEDEIDTVEWDGLKVKFMELWFSEENDFALFHPSDLKKVN
jgi:hypothetical protein